MKTFRPYQQCLLAMAMSAICAGNLHASSHREAPFVTQSPKVDATDFYLFRSYESGREDYVTLIANYLPLQDAYGGPNYFSLDPNAVYEIHVDNDGDAIENITFQFQFDNQLGNSGDGVALDIDGTSVAVADQARVFVGQRQESFAVNLGQVFDLVNLDPLGITDDSANNILADKNITTIAIEVHQDCLTGSGNGVIGAWTTASLPQVRVLNPDASFEQAAVNGGAWTQVSRLSNPLVNEVVIGLPDKDKFNSSEPKDDTQFASYVTNPTLPAILNLLFNSNMEFGVADIAPQNFPRNDLVAAFLTGVAGVNQLSAVTPSEMLRLNTAIPATIQGSQSNLGVAAGDLGGFPNGRRPGDDVVDIALRAVPNDEPVIFDPDSLQADINQAFGSANDTPVAINSNDTVNDIFERVQ